MGYARATSDQLELVVDVGATTAAARRVDADRGEDRVRLARARCCWQAHGHDEVARYGRTVHLEVELDSASARALDKCLGDRGGWR